jgi:hypothetical protein
MSYKQAPCEPHEHEHRGSYFSRAPITPAVLTAVVLLLLAGCGPRDDRYNPSNFHVEGAIAPPEVVIPASARHPGNFNGLFIEPGDSKITALCCWIGTQASMLVKKTLPSSTLSLDVYVPQVPAFESQSQSITVKFSGFGAQSIFPGLKVGFNTLKVRVPARLRNTKGPVRVALRCSVPYVVPMGHQQVQYGALLTSIYFR